MVNRSGAGVGFGMLRGVGIPLLENTKGFLDFLAFGLRFYGLMVVWLYGFMVVWFIVLWFMALGLYGFVLAWFYGFWFYEFYDFLVYSCMVLCLHGFIVVCFMVLWFMIL